MKIKTACNYSNELIKLLDEGKADVDYIKQPVFVTKPADSAEIIFGFDESIKRKPILFHGFMSYGGFLSNTGYGEQFENNPEYTSKLNDCISRCHTPYLSTHIGGTINGIEGIEFIDGIRTSREDTKKIFVETIKNVNTIKTLFPQKILLENIPVYDEDIEGFVPQVECSADPKFISAVVNECDVGFLLDTSHAQIAAEYFGMDIYDYLDQLPLERLVEIHTAGTGTFANGKQIDVHSSLKEIDYQILEYVIKKAPNLEVITLEYSPMQQALNWVEVPFEIISPDGYNPKSADEIERDLARIQDIIQEHEKSLDKGEQEGEDR